MQGTIQLQRGSEEKFLHPKPCKCWDRWTGLVAEADPEAQANQLTTDT